MGGGGLSMRIGKRRLGEHGYLPRNRVLMYVAMIPYVLRVHRLAREEVLSKNASSCR